MLTIKILQEQCASLPIFVFVYNWTSFKGVQIRRRLISKLTFPLLTPFILKLVFFLSKLISDYFRLFCWSCWLINWLFGCLINWLIGLKSWFSFVGFLLSDWLIGLLDISYRRPNNCCTVYSAQLWTRGTQEQGDGTGKDPGMTGVHIFWKIFPHCVIGFF